MRCNYGNDEQTTTTEYTFGAQLISGITWLMYAGNLAAASAVKAITGKLKIGIVGVSICVRVEAKCATEPKIWAVSVSESKPMS